MNIIRQGKGNTSEGFKRISIHWDIFLMCNHKCSYCYCRALTDKWNTFPDLKVQEGIIDSLSCSYFPFNLELLGGEPTYHPHFFKILNLLKEKCSYNETHRTHNNFYIVTNGTRSLDWFDRIPLMKRLNFIFSYHSEINKGEELLKNMSICRDKGFGVKVNLMLHPEKKMWKRIEEFYKKCFDLGFSDINLGYLDQEKRNNDSLVNFNYSEEFWKWSKKTFNDFKKNIYFEEIKNNVPSQLYLNKHDVIFNKLNRFKGFICHNNSFEILLDGIVFRHCEENTKDLKIEKNFFRDLTILEPMICDEDFCHCDGLLERLKICK